MLIIQQIWPGTAPSDSLHCFHLLMTTVTVGWFYFANTTSYPNRTCIIWLTSKAFTLWWKKSRLSDFESDYSNFPIDMAGTYTMGLISMASTYWSPSSLLRDFTSHFRILRHILVRLLSSDFSRSLTRSGEQSDGWNILTQNSLIMQQ